MADTNPNGANQYQMDPRQKLCWEYYTDPKAKDTFGNGLQSAIKAGYEPIYADVITTQDWFKGKVRRMNLLGKAEKVLEKTLDYDTEDASGMINTQLLKTQTDVAKFIASTQGRNEGYSTKTETDLTSKGEKIEGFNYILPDNDK